MRQCMLGTLGLLTLVLNATAGVPEGNRLTYLDRSDPYFVSRSFPKLTTPQWVGEDGIESVVILGIDDMRGFEKWESYLRPILERLKQIDGRAPVSILTCSIDPQQRHLQKWLKEGLSLEAHTIDHPCPILQGADFDRAKSTYDRCVDLMFSVANNTPVAFRVPCCDSLNTPSPRFYAEIFNKRTSTGNFLTIDTSVFNRFTPNDPDLPESVVFDDQGKDRFIKYLPADRTFVNVVEDYPYPYVVGELCWQFPCTVPSDWQGQHLHGANNPVTVEDMKKALDATVVKQGVFDMVFHPHGWIKSEQVIAFIDYAVRKYGKRVKFLTFQEAQRRIDRYLLAGQPLRTEEGTDNGVRLIDLNDDGYIDVVIGNQQLRQSRVWVPENTSWKIGNFPVSLTASNSSSEGEDIRVRFGVVAPGTSASMVVRTPSASGTWHFDGTNWLKDKKADKKLPFSDSSGFTVHQGPDDGVRLRDLDHDGSCELLVSNSQEQGVFSWDPVQHCWVPCSFSLPAEMRLVGAEGNDRGVRFIDVDEDGDEDVLFSNEEGCALYLFQSMRVGWTVPVFEERRRVGQKPRIPEIVRHGTNQGAWFSKQHLWVQNEHTAQLSDLVDKRSFSELLGDQVPGPKSPDDALRMMEVRAGFQVQQVASEPLVMDPVAFAWGTDGKLWVVEMADYPLGIDGQGKAGGRIRYLEDTTGDGNYDQSVLFLDEIGYPTGIMPWRKGVLVTAAPEIFYAEDQNGDGRSDFVQVLYEGFVEGNQQHRVNGLVWGLDNWIYCANGDSGGKVRSLKTGQVLDIRGRDLRIRPDTGEMETQSGQTQFGRNRDDWGNWFGCNNSNPMFHYVLADHYLARNPYLSTPSVRVPVSINPGASPVFPSSQTVERFNDPSGANRFTSANSAMVFRDTWWGERFYGNTFVSEPVHNLVHREVMWPEGSTFRSRRSEDETESEFMSSRDSWFRPAMLKTGPDGALWVADMYRQVIEHPQWIPDDWEERLDLRAGHLQGRIYRVLPVGKSPKRIPRFDKVSLRDLVDAMESPNGWQRDTVQQLIIWRNDDNAVPLLQKMVFDSDRPLARLHALCTLDGLNALSVKILDHALQDKHDGVRRHAVRLTGNSITSYPELGSRLLELHNEMAPQTRMQLAYALGQWHADESGILLAKMLIDSWEDPYLRASILSSANFHVDSISKRVLKSPRLTQDRKLQLIEPLLRMAVSTGNRGVELRILKSVAQRLDSGYSVQQIQMMGQFLSLRRQQGRVLMELNGSPVSMHPVWKQVRDMLETGREALKDNMAKETVKIASLGLLGYQREYETRDSNQLISLLVPQTPVNLQLEVIDQLRQWSDLSLVLKQLVSGWTRYAPVLRDRILDLLLLREVSTSALLDAIENGDIALNEIDLGRRQQLLGHAIATVRQRAEGLFAPRSKSARSDLVSEYIQRGKRLTGNDARGKQLFEKHCSVCHRFNDVGNAVGPDLLGLSDRSLKAMFSAILDPNVAVEAKYVSYLALTQSGQVLSGLVSAESGTSLTLVDQQGKDQVILRNQLESLTSTGKSLMAEGWEEELGVQDLVDIVSYVSSTPAPPKEFNGNQPAVIRQNTKGEWLLTASDGAIYGDTLVFSGFYGTLENWNSKSDYAEWTIEIPQAIQCDVWMHWSCGDNSSGESFLVSVGDQRIEGVVTSTGNEMTFRRKKIGSISLELGESKLRFRSLEDLSGSLIHLKGIYLVPSP